jgi:hypothetical protein
MDLSNPTDRIIEALSNHATEKAAARRQITPIQFPEST